MDNAVADLNEAIRLDPTNAPAYSSRATIHHAVHEIDDAIADFNEAVRFAATDAFSRNSLAWLFATSPDEKHRNGKRAVELATSAAHLTGWADLTIIDTLAAAYAEAGDFAEAVQWQVKAIELLPPNPSPLLKAQFQLRLDLYKSGKPFRDEPPPIKNE
jgi:serine/threonine-protein kinase